MIGDLNSGIKQFITVSRAGLYWRLYSFLSGRGLDARNKVHRALTWCWASINEEKKHVMTKEELVAAPKRAI
ncbi:50S ribosomal protein L25 [Vibrionales bacterium SWAT-3]|nr:50S ribosomal protein L25 [Vibrionales bacterium SWAT-3]